ncbi:MAG: hypothetical protein ACREBO_04960 [Novosphingobium sp.]
MGRTIAATILAGLVLAAPAAAKAPLPDLKACERFTREEGDPELQRTRPLPLPASFKGLARADMDHIAVVTVAGNTLCLDTRFIDEISGAKASPDRRFLAFEWSGYEAYGYILFDRSGRGQVLETGIAPLAPPTGRRFAAIDLSVSAFGGLNAFAVWDILPVGLREAARVSDGLPSGDWRLEGWSGDACINLSLLPIERGDQDGPRDPWFAAESRKWRPRPGRCPN